MTKSLFGVGLMLIAGLTSFLHAQSPSVALRKFSADTVKQAIDELTKELSLKHPGFYRYTSPAEFSRYIDSVESTVNDSLSELAVYRTIKPIVAKIRCLHTGLSLPKAYLDSLNQQPNLFPLQLCFVDDKAYIVQNYSANHAIGVGDELLSINGRTMPSIRDELFSLIPSDGYNITLKYQTLYYQFPTWYRAIDLTETFTIVIKRKDTSNTYQLPGAKFATIVKNGFLKEPDRSKQLAFKIEANVGILTIHSFAKTAITLAHQDFKSFIDQAFMELKRQSIPSLIVDLRDNTGGTDSYAAYFTSYFFEKPFRYWDHIEVTEAFSQQIKGVVLRAFYKKPIQKGGIWTWAGARHSPEFNFYKEQQPAKNKYAGKTYILINGFCMSSCGDASAVLAYNKKAVFVGQETGGGYQGNTSGMIPKATVKPFDFSVTIPLQKYSNAVDPTKNIGRGTMPDYPIPATLDTVLSEVDKSLLVVFDLIKSDTRESLKK